MNKIKYYKLGLVLNAIGILFIFFESFMPLDTIVLAEYLYGFQRYAIISILIGEVFIILGITKKDIINDTPNIGSKTIPITIILIILNLVAESLFYYNILGEIYYYQIIISLFPRFILYIVIIALSIPIPDKNNIKKWYITRFISIIPPALLVILSIIGMFGTDFLGSALYGIAGFILTFISYLIIAYPILILSIFIFIISLIVIKRYKKTS